MDKSQIIKELINVSSLDAEKDWHELSLMSSNEVENLNGRSRTGCKVLDYYFFEERIGTIGNKGINFFNFVNDIEFYNHPSVIPPFLFTSDLQDCLRMFTGQKRVVYNQYHVDYKLSNTFVDKVRKYVNKYMVNTHVSSYQFIDPAMYTTDYFIKSFFKNDCNYTIRLSTILIEKYVVSL